MVGGRNKGQRMTILFDILPLICSLVMGVITELWKQKMAYTHLNRQAEIASMRHLERSVQAARKYETPHTSKVRKLLVIVITLPFVFPMLLEVANWGMQLYYYAMMPHTPWMPGLNRACIYVPETVMSGGLLSFLWNEERVEYAEVCGFVMFPIYVYAFQVILGFYFGQAGAKMRSV